LRLTAAGVSDSRRAAAEKPPNSALLTKDSRFASVSMISIFQVMLVSHSTYYPLIMNQ
jgi:hypothetical protein